MSLGALLELPPAEGPSHDEIEAARKIIGMVAAVLGVLSNEPPPRDLAKGWQPFPVDVGVVLAGGASFGFQDVVIWGPTEDEAMWRALKSGMVMPTDGSYVVVSRPISKENR